jgi:superfamily II DNA or RNA helicase/HKD family nuclease/SAM-dependent methyltransferase
MDDTDRYYSRFATDVFDATVGVDMSSLYARFLEGLPPNAHILDAGCGSGRDAKAFSRIGFRVTAFDASEPLVRLASAHCGFEVGVRRLQDVSEYAAYDAIWCCASLLHVPETEIPEALTRLWRAVRPGGRVFLSLKLGRGERVYSDGRRFTDADESTIEKWLRALPNVLRVETWRSEDRRAHRSDQWINALAVRTSLSDRRLVTGGDDHFLPHLSAAFAQATHVDLAVSFIKTTGLRLLLPDLHAILDKSRATRVRILTSDYLDITDTEALRLLLLLKERGAECRVYVTGRARDSFHLKAYIFARFEVGSLVSGTAFIGSSNISSKALRDGLEWNYRVVYPADHGYMEARDRFEELFGDSSSLDLTDAWIEAYERRRLPPAVSIAPGSQELEAPPVPTFAQTEALDALYESRAAGYRRGLVVLATGMGKTWLAAFDAAGFGAKRILFVAHREEILNQAAATFLRILSGKRVGYFTGRGRDVHVDVLCASIQSIGKQESLRTFSPDHFDYVVVDEFHHASAGTYRRLLQHFSPRFLLGLTATPERTDQSDILSLCDDNLVYSCNLFRGIEAGLLAPFHYYGIQDDTVDYREIPWRNGRFDPEHLSSRLATLARSRHALKEWRSKAQRRTLAFCVSKAHADFMAEQFRREGIDAAAVYSDSALGRAQALEMLSDARLQVVFSVDLFNEGVDLPVVDTIMMLRPTESKVLFLQQLGRGLRRSEGKQQLVVLDFIGNHESFMQKPQALFGVEPTHRGISEFARKVERNELMLPAGCFVNYDLRIVEFLKSLDDGGPQGQYDALRAVLGRRPTLAEFYRAGHGISDVRRHFGQWFELVHAMGDLDSFEASVLDKHSALLREIESTQMDKSFKMVLLEALLELDGLVRPVDVPPRISSIKV